MHIIFDDCSSSLVLHSPVHPTRQLPILEYEWDTGSNLTLSHLKPSHLLQLGYQKNSRTGKARVRVALSRDDLERMIELFQTELADLDRRDRLRKKSTQEEA